MNLSEAGLLVSLNPILLISGLLFSIIIGFFCAFRYRNTNDFAKSLKLLVMPMVILGIVYFIPGIPFLVILGYEICGFVFTALFSNYYFNK